MSTNRDDKFSLPLSGPVIDQTGPVQIGEWSDVEASGKPMEIDTCIEDTPDVRYFEWEVRLIPVWTQWLDAREKRVEFQQFRIRALRLPLHQRYTPLLPSPLRNVVTVSDLPENELSDAETVDDPRSNGTAMSEAASSASDGSISPGLSSNGSDVSDELGWQRKNKMEAKGPAIDDRSVTSAPPPSPAPPPQ
ncbi:hypothetical protein L209DRAFT_713853 [Thermothelomyces heterothallicus CBS 203.75]